MSYARFGWDDSDVYVYCSRAGIECCVCHLQQREWVDDPGYPILGGYLAPVGERIKTTFTDTDGAVAHMAEHVAAGHVVSPDVVPELLADRDENERLWATGARK